MKTRALLLVVVVAVVAAGCFGGSSANAPTSTASSTPSASSGSAPVLDSATRARLLAEYRAAKYECPNEVVCRLRAGVFPTGRLLLAQMARLQPSMHVTRIRNSYITITAPLVFVLPDSTANHLDIATNTADGSIVHLIAVGTHKPHFKFAPL